MENVDKINLGNLFSLFELVAMKPQGVEFIKRKNFSLISANDSVWPNMLFRLDNETMDDEIINEVVELIKGRKEQPLIILLNEANSLSKVRKKGLMPIDQWVGMHLDSFEKIRPGEKHLALSLVEREADLIQWTQVVSHSLFKSKELDAAIFDYLRQNDVKLVMAKSSNKVVGTAMIYSQKNGVTGIYMVGVLESFRGKGIGKEIINYCIELISHEPNFNCILQATRQGQPVYKSFGFNEAGTYNLYLKIR